MRITSVLKSTFSPSTSCSSYRLSCLLSKTQLLKYRATARYPASAHHHHILLAIQFLPAILLAIQLLPVIQLLPAIQLPPPNSHNPAPAIQLLFTIKCLPVIAMPGLLPLFPLDCACGGGERGRGELIRCRLVGEGKLVRERSC